MKKYGKYGDREYYTKLFHDLRSGLSIMDGYASLVQEDDSGGLTSDQKDYIVKIRDGYKKTLSILNNANDLLMLDFAKMKKEN